MRGSFVAAGIASLVCVAACGPKQVMARPIYYATCDEMADCNAKALKACGPNNQMIKSAPTSQGTFVAKYECGDERASEIQPHDDGPSIGQRVLRGIGAGAAAGGAAMQGQSPSVAPAPATSPSPAPRASGCSNDYECGFGNVCVKQQFSVEGTCARAVDRNGIPTYTPPRSDSVGPGGAGECAFDTECPVGFRCIKGSALRGHCMK
jgi:hypothetical protein